MSAVSDHSLKTRNKEIFNTAEGKEAKYKSTMRVTQFSKAGTVLRTYRFKGAWPSSLSTINLDWGTQEIEEYTCTWTYDSWSAVGSNTDEQVTDD